METISSLLAQFRKDLPWNPVRIPAPSDLLQGEITGCKAISLNRHADERGYLTELLTMRDGDIEPIVHVYQVFAESRSLRAWICHAKQTDRLCFTDGLFRIALFDLREESATYGRLATLTAGAESPTQLTIPPLVAHGVMNMGATRASYLNLPNRVYDPKDPDKYRLPADSSLIDFAW